MTGETLQRRTTRRVELPADLGVQLPKRHTMHETLFRVAVLIETLVEPGDPMAYMIELSGPVQKPTGGDHAKQFGSRRWYGNEPIETLPPGIAAYLWGSGRLREYAFEASR